MNNIIKRNSKIVAKKIKEKGITKTIAAIVNYLIFHKKRIAKKYYLSCLKHLFTNNLLLKTVQDSKMYLNPSDPGISTELFFKGVHEPLPTKIYQQELSKDMTIIDIGANIGYYALQEALIIGEKGQVYAIEPVIDNFNLLQKNIELNKYKHIKAYHIAVSSKIGITKMALTDSSNLGCMLDTSNDCVSDYVKEKTKKIYRESVNVNTITVDEFVKRERIKQINFIRMDIEGYEIEAFKGMIKTLKNTLPPLKLFIEFHIKFFNNPEITVAPLLKQLFSFGFKPKYLIVQDKNKTISNLSEDAFIKTVCSYKSDCPHIFFEKK